MLDAKKLGLSGGILGGLFMLVFTLISVFTGYAHDGLAQLSSFYPGYSVSVGGSVVGLIYGFVDGFVWLFLLGWIYNHVKI